MPERARNAGKLDCFQQCCASALFPFACPTNGGPGGCLYPTDGGSRGAEPPWRVPTWGRCGLKLDRLIEQTKAITIVYLKSPKHLGITRKRENKNPRKGRCHGQKWLYWNIAVFPENTKMSET